MNKHIKNKVIGTGILWLTAITGVLSVTNQVVELLNKLSSNETMPFTIDNLESSDAGTLQDSNIGTINASQVNISINIKEQENSNDTETCSHSKNLLAE